MAISVGPKPTLYEPVQIASTSLAGHTGSDAQSHLLQALPNSSSSCHGAFAVGAAFRVSSRGTPKRSRDLAAYASPAAGLVVLNVNTQTPLFSPSISTSQYPTTPPLVLHDCSYRATFIVMRDRSDDDSTELHVWSEESATTATTEKCSHHSIRVPPTSASLHALSRSEIAVTHSDGAVSIYSFGSLSKCEPVLSSSLRGTGSRVLDLFAGLFDRNASMQMLDESEDKPTQALLVRVSIVKATEERSETTKSRGRSRRSATDIVDESEGRATTMISFIAIDDSSARNAEQRMRVLGQKSITEVSLDRLSRLHVHSSGRIAILTDHKRLTTGFLRSSPVAGPGVVKVSSVQLEGLHKSSSVLVVSRSTVILAGIGAASSDSATRMNMLLLDVEINSVLADFSWKVAEDTGDTFMHRLGGDTAMLLTAPASGRQGKAMARLWSVPFATGEGYHLRWSLVMRHLTRKWLEDNFDSKRSTETMGGGSTETLLLRLTQTLSSTDKSDVKVKAAEKIFADWLHTQRVQRDGRTNETSTESQLSQALVKPLLAIVLPPGSKAKDSYPQKIVQTLLKHRAVHAADVDQSALLQALTGVEDWDSLRLALQVVDDLQEADVVDGLHAVLSRVIDGKADRGCPSTAEILTLVASAKLNSAKLRRAMKDKLDIAGVEAILTVVQSWIQTDSKQPLLKINVGDEAGDSVNRLHRPSMLQALSFAIDIMDTFFPLMLSSPSTEGPLKEISSSLKFSLSTTQALGMLRGPLAAFAKVEEDREREAEALLIDSLALLDSDAEEEDADDDENDEDRRIQRSWASGGRDALGGKAGRPRSQASASMQIGGGAHARSGQKEKTRRQQAYADRMAVGLYTLERFEP